MNPIEEIITQNVQAFESDLLLPRENGLMLRNHQIDILKRNQIDYRNFSTMKQLLFEIERVLKEEEVEECLEQVASEISEWVYYHEMNR